VAGVASVRVGERRILEIVNKYGKDVFLHAVEEYLDYGERVSLAALKRLPKGTYSLVEEQDAGPAWKSPSRFGTASLSSICGIAPTGQGPLQHEPRRGGDRLPDRF